MRIGVFRALMLGDLLCAVPALRALRAAHPGASIALIGLPWAQALAQRLPQLDEFIAFPGWPGLPEQPPALAEIPGFLQRMQAERFDLLLQMHGSGQVVNPLLAAFGARRLAGFVAPGAWCGEPASHCAWPERGHEIERLLSLTDHLGLPRHGLQLEFPLVEADRREAAALLPAWRAAPCAIVHAGSQLPSRRWGAERFAAVADGLARRGLRVLLTGSAGEAPLVGTVQALMREPAQNLAGRTSLWALGALVERAALVVCNDTGLSHIAAALGTPSVVVACGSDVARWRPLDARRHRVLWQPMACRPCAHADCPVGHGCASAISVGAVLAAVDRQLAAPGLAARRTVQPALAP